MREPHNPYDRNAIRVDNLHGEKVGHVKGTSAQLLAPVMDSRSLHVRIDASIPRKGNKFTMPLLLQFYSEVRTNNSTTNDNENEDDINIREASAKVAAALAHALKRDYIFTLSHEFGGQSFVQNAGTSGSYASPGAVIVEKKKMDWQQQERELDEMFDKQLQDQMKQLPKVNMPNHLLRGIELFDYQVQGIKWLVKQETHDNTCTSRPFYKQVRENGAVVRSSSCS